MRPPNRLSVIPSRVLAATDSMLVIENVVKPSKVLTLGGIDVIAPGYRAVWFLLKNQPWDIARFFRPDGSWTGYYVDVLEPVHWTNSDPSTLQPVTDLFLDLWISPGGSYVVLDEDELAEAIEAGDISRETADRARGVLHNLIEAIDAGSFPPDSVRDFRIPGARVERSTVNSPDEE